MYLALRLRATARSMWTVPTTSPKFKIQMVCFVLPTCTTLTSFSEIVTFEREVSCLACCAIAQAPVPYAFCICLQGTAGLLVCVKGKPTVENTANHQLPGTPCQY
ncbi:hypothetical protein VFPPC_17507 [Pochonia chlamydosporia 170]|uniref:Uncharacterized protein n=1 Tax=Pochonia chlamydosporia 170 TaxID=1380566 RepID=A0A219ARD9_METCM|nr:hypothetical protein VFPPC_17507 [Pochonia chlamydosporia 170]OWT43330.1 hypothetical protein VFPPC_17507 [Pochonia chlamydosporia 170]